MESKHLEEWAAKMGFGVLKSVQNTTFSHLCTPQLEPVWEWITQNINTINNVKHSEQKPENLLICQSRFKAVERRRQLAKRLHLLKTKSTKISAEITILTRTIHHDTKSNRDLNLSCNFKKCYNLYIDSAISNLPSFPESNRENIFKCDAVTLA
jgi:hypothetical protein